LPLSEEYANDLEKMMVARESTAQHQEVLAINRYALKSRETQLS
jgi:hypothetical protein